MKFFPILALSATLLVSSTVNAKEVAGVEVNDTLTIEQQALTLNGAGVRSKFFMDLYVGSLYLAEPQQTAEQVIEQPVSVIRLNITSGMITSDKMIDAIEEGFDLATKGDTSAIQTEIDQFMALFSDEIKEGDQFTFIMKKGEGVSSLKNNVTQGDVKGELFRQALINIWLGDKPAQKSLRKAMLGQ
ncbi:chalcone isomerase family protein [Shewanella gaetbuli]|uniref:Chalcone isomerase family protein n=1 Tax=Shewanella gaetbuli TaxID=220752 RepID=A0A9X1ZHP3_9GAMM|nr:chalcone isomerase family protein [Shewanella gaetbuli]MCL1141716.1 chalcone isomerase family protein [Shewanella gaetbuli]